MQQKEWKSLTGSDRLRRSYEVFLRVFPPNPYKYGVLRGYSEHGKKNVYTNIFHERGEEAADTWPTVLSRHFQAADEGRIGYLPGSLSGTVVGCIDIDRHAYGDATEDVLRSVLDAAQTNNVMPLLEKSTNGGWHVWVWTNTEIPYETMRDALRRIVDVADVGILETYPMGPTGARGRWIFVPYAGFTEREDGLGRTYLQDAFTEDPIPIWELETAVKKVSVPKKVLSKLASQFEKTEAEAAEASTERGTLAPEALEQLRKAATNPPEGFDRHHSVFAFVNVAEKAGDGLGREMVEFLQSKEIHGKWVEGRAGERNHQEWVNELERIWEHVRNASGADRGRYGLSFLLKSGWEVPELERKVETLGAAKGWTKAIDDDIAAQWAAARLDAAGKPLAFEGGTPFTYGGGTWYPLAGLDEAIGHVVENVLRPEGARIKSEQMNNRVLWMLRRVCRRDLSDEVSRDHLSLENGLLNLRTGELLPHTKDIVTIGRVPVSWRKMEKKREDALLEPLRNFLRDGMYQEDLGEDHLNTLVEDYFRAWAWAIDPAKRGRYFLDFHGPTSTGKSTAVKAALLVLGDSSYGDPHGLWTSLDADSIDVQDFTANLVGRQGVHFDDLALSGDKRSDRKTINLFKKIAGGAVLAVNRKFQASEQAQIHARVVVSTNTIMAAGNGSDSEALNMRAWRFGFMGKAVDRTKQLPEYERTLLPTDEHRLAFLRTVVRYWRAFDAAGGVRPLESVSAQQAAFADTDHFLSPVLNFLSARVDVGTLDDRVTTSTLVEAYNDWAKRAGERPHDPRSFGAEMKTLRRELKQRGWKEVRPVLWRNHGSPTRGWTGLRLRVGQGVDLFWDDEEE